MLAGGPPKGAAPPVPKAPPKFAYPQPTFTRPLSNAIALEDEEEPKGVAPAVPKRARKRSLSTGDETEVDQWRAQNNIGPQHRAVGGKVAPPPPKKPLSRV